MEPNYREVGSKIFTTGYEEDEELVFLIAAWGRMTPARLSVKTEEIISPPIYVPLAEKSELQENITNKDLQNISDIGLKNTENSEQRLSEKLRAGRLPDCYGATGFC